MHVPKGLQVKGVSFVSIVSVVQKHRGRALVDQAIERMEGDAKDALKHGAIIAAGWYPLEWYAELWRGLLQASAGGDEFVRHIGRASIDHDFNTIYKAVFRMLSPKTLVSIGIRHFSNIYDTGTVTVVDNERNYVRVKWTGCTGFTHAMWVELLGACERLAELAGVKHGRGVFEQGGNDEDSCTAKFDWR